MTTTWTKKPGVYPSASFEEYLSWPAASSHDLMTVLRSPKHYHYKRLHPSEPTPAMELGTAVHHWILTPDEAVDHVAVIPEDINRRTKAGREAFEEWTKQHEGKTFVSPADSRRIAGMAGTVKRHKAAQQHLEAAPNREHSFVWTHGATGMLCRGRPDAYGPEVIVDLKTAADAQPEAFSRSVHSYYYHLQAFAYLYGLFRLEAVEAGARFVFIVVEKTPPYQVEVYELEPEDIVRGGELYTLALQELKACQEADSWDGDTTLTQTIGLPRWARERHDRRYHSDIE
jgi:exodeoxyribonuclease VIII